MIIPENTIAVISDHTDFDEYIPEIIYPMAGNKRRDWFVQHAYFCLPLVIGNQYGFAIRSMYDFTAEWDGSTYKNGVIVEVKDCMGVKTPQLISSHFGMGTVTIQNRFHFRTPPGVNLMTINPPNTWIDGVQHMTGVIETDNLRRDFTFNIKLTRPHHKVHFKKGDLIGCVIPIQRYFVDGFNIANGRKMFTEQEIAEEDAIKAEFQFRRENIDINMPNRNGRLYAKGLDAFEQKFADHQTAVKKHPKLTGF